eukprot:7235518-Prymnesium_polylepis.1
MLRRRGDAAALLAETAPRVAARQTAHVSGVGARLDLAVPALRTLRLLVQILIGTAIALRNGQLDRCHATAHRRAGVWLLRVPGEDARGVASLADAGGRSGRPRACRTWRAGRTIPCGAGRAALGPW